MTTDAVLKQTNNIYDFGIDARGDIETDSFFDTAILYSLFGERRAVESEISQPELRRGWIGNEGKDYENGSGLWIYSQSKLTRSAINRIEDEAKKSLQWLVDDGFAVAITDVSVTLNNGRVAVELTIRRTPSEVERRYFELWNATGVR
jgi:phage gp46-like protein